MASHLSIRLHGVTAIHVKYEEGSTYSSKWMDFTFVCDDGSKHEVTAFVDRPLAIEGAELINLMAAHEKETTA